MSLTNSFSYNASLPLKNTKFGSGGEGHGNSTHGVTGIDMRWVLNEQLTYAALVFVVITCIVSLSDIREHMIRFDYPKIQVLAFRIILMMPIYAVFSGLSLVFYNIRFFLITLRDVYESFVLYMFMLLMLAYCGGEGQLLRSLKAKRYKGLHLFPVCWLPTYPLDTAFYLRCKRWVLQCALIKPICTFVAMIAHPLGVYSESNFSPNNVYTYNCLILNFSLTWSLYYLVLFEVELEKELHYMKPFLKFLSIKAIIFFSYWQFVGFNVAATAGVVYLGATEEEHERVSAAVQDLLMCFELLPVALLHRAAFGRDKLDEEMAAVPVYMKSDTQNNMRSNLDTALNINDVIDDTIATIFYRRGKLVDQENDDGIYEDNNNASPANQTDGFQNWADNGVLSAHDRDPTVEELVRHAIASDYGVRVDGLLHYDVDSERDENNYDMQYSDTDVILHNKRNEEVSDAVRVDTDVLRSNQLKQGFGTPQIYCVVCGRFDREMVRRKNGYKCKECVGTKSQTLLRTRQEEMLQPTAIAERPAPAQQTTEPVKSEADQSNGTSTLNPTASVLANAEDNDQYVQALDVDADGADILLAEANDTPTVAINKKLKGLIQRFAGAPSSGSNDKPPADQVV